MADSNDNPDNKAPENTPKPAKKPYKKPELIYWGTLQELTGSVGFISKVVDGGKGVAKKTS
jgi:hypothetical protein